MENKKFEIVSRGERDESREQKIAEFETLIGHYAAGTAEHPTWCVWGSDGVGGRGILHWIKPVEEAKLVAYRIAKLVTELGGSAKAKMTEWNPDLEGEPIYKKETKSKKA